MSVVGIMNANNRMYVDSFTIKKMLDDIALVELIEFFSKRLIIPIDDKTYDYLLVLQDEYFLNNP